MGPDQHPKVRSTFIDYSTIATSSTTFVCIDEIHEMPPYTTGSVITVSSDETEIRIPDPQELDREFLAEQETERFFLRMRRREDRRLLRRREWRARDRRFQRSVRRGQKRGRRERRQQGETE